MRKNVLLMVRVGAGLAGKASGGAGWGGAGQVRTGCGRSLSRSPALKAAYPGI